MRELSFCFSFLTYGKILFFCESLIELRGLAELFFIFGNAISNNSFLGYVVSAHLVCRLNSEESYKSYLR